MGVLILLDHRGCHVNSSPTGAFLFEMIPSFSPSARSILSFLNGVCFIHPKLSLFSSPPTLFLQGLRFRNHVSFYWWEVSSFFLSMFLSSDFPRRCSTVLSSSSFVLFSSLVDPIQAFSVDHIPFLVSNAFSCRCTSQSLTSCYSFVLEC